MNDYIPSQSGITIEEFIDSVQTMLTISCALPKNLPDLAVRQIVEKIAMPYFYRHYNLATQVVYYYVDRMAFTLEEFTKYSYINLPCEIQYIRDIKIVTGNPLFSLGINAPNLSLNMGVTNQPYLSSYVTTIGELGVYKTLLDNLADMINHLSLNSTKFDYNPNNNRLHILTKLDDSLVVEAYAKIPMEYLMADDLFYKYVVGYAKVQLGNLVSYYDFNLQGQVKINGSNLISQGQEEIKSVEEIIRKTGGGGAIMMMNH